MLLQFFVHLVALINLQHHRIKLPVKCLICSAFRTYSSLQTGGRKYRILRLVTTGRGEVAGAFLARLSGAPFSRLSSSTTTVSYRLRVLGRLER